MIVLEEAMLGGTTRELNDEWIVFNNFLNFNSISLSFSVPHHHSETGWQ
jgi:hypothetical protein